MLIKELKTGFFSQKRLIAKPNLMWNALCSLFFTVIQWPEKMKRSAVKQETVIIQSEQAFVRKIFPFSV